MEVVVHNIINYISSKEKKTQKMSYVKTTEIKNEGAVAPKMDNSGGLVNYEVIEAGVNRPTYYSAYK